MKYYPNPPEIIANIAKAFCIILSPENLSWEAFKKICADKSVIQKMKNVDKDNFKYQSFKIIADMFDTGLISSAKAEKESQACLNLFNWLYIILINFYTFLVFNFSFRLNAFHSYQICRFKNLTRRAFLKAD